MSAPDPRTVQRFAMRPLYRWLLTWVPLIWLVAVGIVTVRAVTDPRSNGFLFFAPLFLIYGLAFLWLSRFQVYEVRLGAEEVRFVAPARTTVIHYEDLVEIAPARGVLQGRLATRFRGEGRRRVTVLGRAFPGFPQLVATLEERSTTRVVRY